MSTKGEQAKAMFEQGYNCAQSVFGAFARELGLEPETALLLASPFGGGMGRLREVCGAVSGMLMVAGLTRGYSAPDDNEKQRVYALTQELAGRFREKNGSILCRELLGLEGQDTNPVPSARTSDYYQRRPCGELIAYAAELAEELLEPQARQA